MKSQFVAATAFVLGGWVVVLGTSLPACGSPKPPVEPQVTQIATDAGGHDAADPVVEKSLFERLGGKDGVAVIVDSLLKNVAADPRFGKSFAKTFSKTNSGRRDHFKDSLVEQICDLSRGPDCHYAGKPMKEAHAGMKINEGEFKAFIEDLQMALAEHNVAPAEQAELTSLLDPMKDDIVDPKTKRK
jgi:hemoglobin